ncbi:hypothetical protein C8A03DRAFT_34753 [Achaetomium macrosporum]|uniref:Mob1/phocein n=1 Tax=Achaetomium macrosporum TaxID=79813 RepID=A0AAN7C8M3_9PEZI|nr:hypothetical protein C8A03DRAFT_34753 [Achaetomium macrosporum]
MSLPPSSPRLPSPPPPAEYQIGPKSPLMGPNAARQAAQIEQTAIDTNAKRRIHPGTKSADMAAGPPLVPLHELDSAFQLQEHLAALHYYHTASHTTPISRETAKLLANPPPGIDRTLWLYELCRFLIAQCNTLIVGFLFDTPPCNASTCPEMRAGEWQFLCAVHDTPKSCCAIDYCCHTLDWAANVVTNPKIFPSRFVVDAHDKSTAVKNLVNVFRRLHRIFAHAWFQHRGVFWSVESQGGLYVFFKTVCDVYDLLPTENYKLPPEAEGLDNNTGAGGDLGDRSADRRQQQQQQPQHLAPLSIAKPPSQRDGDDGDYPSVSRTNTRRHIKSSPSVGSAVTTVPEADEDDSTDLSNKLAGMRISSAPAAPADRESEPTSIPLIVDPRPLTTAEQPLRPSSVIPPPGTAANEGQPGLESDGAKQESEEAAETTAAPNLESAHVPEMRLGADPEPEPETEEMPSAAAAEEPQQTEEPAAADEGPVKAAEDIGNQAAPPARDVQGNDLSSSSSAAVAEESEADAGKPEQPTSQPLAVEAGDPDAETQAAGDQDMDKEKENEAEAGAKAEEEAGKEAGEVASSATDNPEEQSGESKGQEEQGDEQQQQPTVAEEKADHDD